MTRLNQALHVVARYHTNLKANEVTEGLRAELTKLEPLLKITQWNEDRAKEIAAAINRHLQPIYRLFAKAA
jgi:hypothetical protein